MGLRNRDIIEQLLALIENDQCKLALKTWSDHRHTVTDSCDHCPYEAVEKNVDCSMCLETKLRTLSLYEHDCDDFERSLLSAARKLDQYQHQALHA